MSVHHSISRLITSLSAIFTVCLILSGTAHSARFTDNGDGTVTDTTTSLVWLKDTNCLDAAGGVSKTDIGTIQWTNATTWSSGVATGICGLRDGSTAGQWRLPTLTEFKGIVDQTLSPALPAGHPFTNIKTYYWTSSGYPNYGQYAFMDMASGAFNYTDRIVYIYAWPVRNGSTGTPTVTCGSSNGQSFTTPPVTNLCVNGSASTTPAGAGPWTWTCAGTNGATAICSASQSSTVTPVNGTCGASNGVSASIAPTFGLCTSGTATAVTNSGPWYWSCAGSNGGTTASCYTLLAPSYAIAVTPTVNGTVACTTPVPSGSNSSCTITPNPGYQLDRLIDTVNGYQQANLTGVSYYLVPNVTAVHTITATFSLIPPAKIDGICGLSSAGPFSVAPNAGLCAVGAASAVSGSGPWNWTCAGSGGGITAACTASKTKPRFTSNADGTITDSTTTLVWLLKADCSDPAGGVTPVAGLLDWNSATTWSNSLASGICGLTDSSTAGQWRLPAAGEWQKLLVVSGSTSSLPNDFPFIGNRQPNYWSSSLDSGTSVFYVDFNNGVLPSIDKGNKSHVWAVRNALPGSTGGACGSAANQNSTVAPATGLCATGYTPSAVGSAGSSWQWTCTDTANTGATAQSCSAGITSVAVGGVCGNADKKSFSAAPAASDLCATGSAASTVTGSGPWNWTCTGSNNGSATKCTADLDGTCGTANNKNLTTAPTAATDLCSTGTPSTTALSGTAPWSWTCSGSASGKTANCSTPPLLTISTLPDGKSTTDAILNVSGTVKFAGSGKSLTINSQPVTVASSGAFSSAIALAEGGNGTMLTTVATDSASNATTDSRTITLDRSAPLIKIDQPADNSTTNKTSVVVNGSVADATVSVTVAVNGGTATTAAVNGKSFTATLNLTDGLNTIDITATSQAGKSSHAKRTITLSAATPTLAISYPAQDISTPDNIYYLEGLLADAVTSANISISVEAGQSYTQNDIATGNSFFQTIVLPTDKTYAVTVTATDKGGNNLATVQRNIIKSSAGKTKARVYLDTADAFTISNSGAYIYGGAGKDSVAIAVGTTGVMLDQNIEQISFSGASGDYAFKQTGNSINVYGTVVNGAQILASPLIANVPVQSGGTLLSFTDGSATALLTAGAMTLGGVQVNSVTATKLSGFTLQKPAAAPSAPAPAATTAKVYLGADGDIFTVNNSGATLYGGAGNDVVTIAAGVTGVTLDQNVEKIIFSDAVGGYQFKQTGNKINVYDTTGTTLIMSAPVQGDTDGTVLTFSDGSASALLTAGVMTLGGATVTTTVTKLTPTLK